jgi:tRNA (guanosine-2'-O-)-methyltransferase
VEKYGDAWKFLEKAGQEGSVISTEMGAQDISEVDWESMPKPFYFVMGNEHRGVSKLIRQNSTQCISLPAWGMVQSFNVSVATALLFSHLQHQKILSANPKDEDRFSEDEQKEILAKWLMKDVRGSNFILKRNECLPIDM